MTHDALLDPTCEVCRSGMLWLERELLSTEPHFRGRAAKRFDHARVDWYPTLAGLRESAAAGCELCRLIRAAALSNDAANVFKDQSVNIQDTCMLRIQIGFVRQRDKAERVKRRVSESEPEIMTAGLHFQFHLAIGEQSILTSNLRRGQWKPSIDVYMMLVDVRGDILRIVKNTEIGPEDRNDLKYLALSYCWGVQADTVSVAKALSIPYIWVDALCIRQDDYNDWDHESAFMDKVYANSFVTICAVSSTNCQEGYLHRDGTQIPMCIIGLGSQDMTPPSCLIQALPIISHGDPYRPLTHELQSSTWNRRAWTYQENALSTRCIFFCHSGVHFPCSNFECSEYLGVVGESRFKGSSPAKTRVLLRDDFTNPEDQRSLNLAWAQVISDYSRRDITRATDLFPSLSGLAKEFSRRFGSQQYVAGSWKAELLKGLMWRVEEEAMQPLDKRLSFELLLEKLCGQPYISPSWSWVGREQQIQPCDQFSPSGIPDYEGGSISYPAYKRLESSVTPLTGNIFGKISTAKLILETHIYHLASGALLPDKQPSNHPIVYHNGLPVQLGGKDGPLFQLELDWKFAGNEEDLDSLTLALLGSSTVSEEYSDHPFEKKVKSKEKRPFGLVLHSAADNEQYLRVGIFSIPGEALIQDELPHWKFFENCKVLPIQKGKRQGAHDRKTSSSSAGDPRKA
ncbi:C6 transcription factor [Diaporthe amygdali]|uniref:C6 transcription factor n=1 Tax=Phomopsis amygdali TaxID=1214568 RepID=UPI0022FE5C14|nr:C6 transcription factor [Diaporthe amygdali]KAJ0119733.1 C6 transcription factor [Diaporthe amygdali]